MEKLEIIADQIGKFGMVAAAVTVLSVWIKITIQIWGLG